VNYATGTTGCKLSTTNTSCDIVLDVNAYIGTVSFGSYSQFTFTIRNECFAIDSTQAIWTFSTEASSFDKKFPLTYEIWHGATPSEVILPRPTLKLPSELLGGIYTASAECGTTFTYSVENPITTTVASLVDPTTTTGFTSLKIESKNPSHSGQTRDTDFKQVYKLDFTATLAIFGIKVSYTKGTSQPDLEFFMQDRCVGMYFPIAPTITANYTDMNLARTPAKFQLTNKNFPTYHL